MIRLPTVGIASCAAFALLASPLRAETHKVPQDHATIQEACDAAVDGDTVQVAKGVYHENVLVSHAITLKGASGAIIDGGYHDNCIFVNVAGVTVTGFTLENGGNGISALSDGVPLPAGGLLVIATDVDISKLTISGCQDFGIRLLGTGSIQTCKVNACVGVGIDVETGNSLGQTATLVKKNTVTLCGSGMLLLDGPFLVDSNTCGNNQGHGIQAELPAISDGGNAMASSFTRNKCTANQDIGLSVVADLVGAITLVEKNTCQDNATGLDLEGSAIDAESNTVTDNSRCGIFLLAGSSTLNKNKVQSNGGVGVWVGSSTVLADGTSFDSNMLSSNTIQGNGGDGLHITSSANSCTQNTIKDNAGDGIDIDAGPSDNTLGKNTVQDNQHDGIDNSGLLTTMVDNKVKGNGGAAIAGAGDGPGTVQAGASTGNTVDDDSDLVTFATTGKLEMLTVFDLP